MREKKEKACPQISREMAQIRVLTCFGEDTDDLDVSTHGSKHDGSHTTAVCHVHLSLAPNQQLQTVCISKVCGVVDGRHPTLVECIDVL